MSGRYVVITGAASGIGRAMAETFAATGAKVAVLDRDEDALAETCEALECAGRPAVVSHSIDLADKVSVDSFWAGLPDELGRPDTLINNAGIYPMRPFLEVDEDYLEHVMRVDLCSAFYMSQGFVRLRGSEGGIVINVSSIEALAAFKPEMVPYVISKAGILGFTRALAREYGPKGFRVNTLIPGGIKTPGTKAIAKRIITRGEFGLLKAGYDFLQRLPIGRFGEPEEVASVALFLASDLASYVHGAEIRVDGGFLSA